MENTLTGYARIWQAARAAERALAVFPPFIHPVIHSHMESGTLDFTADDLRPGEPGWQILWAVARERGIIP